MGLFIEVIVTKGILYYFCLLYNLKLTFTFTDLRTVSILFVIVYTCKFVL